MTHSERIDTIGGAIRKAQKAVGPAKRDGFNQTYQAPYATLEAVWEAARVPLERNRLTVVQSDGLWSLNTRTVTVTTLCVHASGQWIETDCAAPALPTSDDVFAVSTRLRRRALAALLAIVQEDADGAGQTATASRAAELRASIAERTAEVVA